MMNMPTDHKQREECAEQFHSLWASVRAHVSKWTFGIVLTIAMALFAYATVKAVGAQEQAAVATARIDRNSERLATLEAAIVDIRKSMTDQKVDMAAIRAQLEIIVRQTKTDKP